MNGYGRGEDNQNKGGGSVVTRETFGMTLLFFSVILLVFSMVGPYILGDIGVSIAAFLYGALGFFVYPFFFLCIYGSLVMISGKKFIRGVWILRIFLLTLCAFLIAHLASSVRFAGEGFGTYLSGCWNAAETSTAQSTAGGLLLGLFVYPVMTFLTMPGAYVVFTILTLAAAIFFLWGTPVRNLSVHSRAQKEPKEEKPRQEEAERKSAPAEQEKRGDYEPPRQIRQVQPQPQPRAYDASNQYPNYNQDPDLSRRRPPLDDGTQDRRYGNYDGYDEPQLQRRDDLFGRQEPKLRPDPWQMPRRDEQMQRRIEQTPPRKTEPVSPKQEKPVSSRDILFSNDPVKDYWSNLAYNGDGYFNNRIRRSSMQPVTGANGGWSDTSTEQKTPTYSEEYHTRAERPQQYVERQIIEQKPDSRDEGYTLHMDDLNYTRKPSYEEPKPAQPEERKSELFERNVPDELNVRNDDLIEPRREDMFNRNSDSIEPRREDIFNRNSDSIEPRREDIFNRNSDSIEPRREDIFNRNNDSIEPRREDMFNRNNDSIEPHREDIFNRNSDSIEPRREDMFNRNSDSIEPRREDMFSRNDDSIEPRREDIFNRNSDSIEPRREDMFSRNSDSLEPRREDMFNRNSDSIEPRRDELFNRNEETIEPRRDEELFGDLRRDDNLGERTEDRRMGFGDDMFTGDRHVEERNFDEPESDFGRESFGRDDRRMDVAPEDSFESFGRDDRRMDFESGNNFESAAEEFSRERQDEPRFDARTDSEELSAIPTLFPEKRELFEKEDVEAVQREIEQPSEAYEAEEDYRDIGGSRAMDGIGRTADIFDGDDVEPYDPDTASKMTDEEKPRPKEKHVYKPYVKPSLSLLRRYDDSISVPQEEIERNSAIIIDTLAGFRVDAEVANVKCGPSVTRYDIDIPKNISLNTVIKRSGEIAMRLHARDGVNMYANNETGTISIEVPNSVRATVGLLSVMESEEYQSNKPGALMFAIGKDIEGRNVCGNIPKMTHILVAGTTNAGKSVALNAMLVSLVCKYSPEDLRLILVDPKRTEFIIYDGLPHLMINEIIGDAQKAIMALNWSIKEMERRFALFEQKTRSGIVVHNIDEFNATLQEGEEKLPKIVFVVDELADLMSVSKKDIEERIQRLTQKARAAGIHLVLATQRPSVDVITGVIKGNLPTRMAVRVIQEVDSRTILDEGGAEKLLGMGDMLFKTGGMFNCLRVQGAFIDNDELMAVMNAIKQNNESYFDPEVSDFINKTEEVSDDEDEGKSRYGGGSASKGDEDPLYVKSLAIVVKIGSASISLIQRKCAVGYNHAGKILEWMEERGYVSPFDGKAKARTVLLTKEEFESKYGPLDSF